MVVAGPWASCVFELPALGPQVGFGMAWSGSWGLATMPVHFLALVRTRKQDGGIAFGGVQGQQAKSEYLAPGLEELAAHMKCTHCQFGHLLHAHISGYSPYNHCGFAFLPGSFTFSISWKGTEVAGWYDS